ncbi:type II secretion system F family protein [Adlercreutzia sp.]|uniref:type II secretion system F family protein n=1 Tax=Adlercreutzia sp. TaxID=1872387 RepID=UPI003FD863BB
MSAAGPLTLAAGPAAAWLYVRAKRKSREKLFDSQLSGALLMMSHSLEGGITLEAAIESVGRYVEEPLRSELERVSSEMRYGVPFLASLENMSRRVRCKDMPLVIAAASVNAETGCDLAPVLAKISATIDGRIALRRHIAAITSGGKVQTVILAVLPIAVMGSLLVMAPDFYSSMLASPIGWAAIGVAAAMDIAGVALSRHLQKMKVD